MKRKHTYREWHFCLPHENLFDLDSSELARFRLIIKESP